MAATHSPTKGGTVMSTATLDRPAGQTSPRTRTGQWPRQQWRWLSGGLVLAVALPYLLTDLLTINRDLYYGVYAVVVFRFFALWLRRAIDAPRALLTRNWRWGVLLGVLFAGVTAAIGLSEKATPHPHGVRFAAAI